jgi:type IV secretory pathway VirJ component
MPLRVRPRHGRTRAVGFRLVVLVALGGVMPVGQPALAQSGPRGDSTSIVGLPVVEVPTRDSVGTWLGVVLSGDGGWAAGDRAMTAALGREGIPVVGLNVPSYIKTPRTPDVAANDLGRLLEHYLQAWRKERVLLIGYSHGADLAPFMVSRLAPDLRRRIGLLALVGLEDHASFRFHLSDVVGEVARPGDLPTVPELEKLRGLPMLCIGGENESHSPCRSLDPSLARVETHGGGHRLSSADGTAVVGLILSAARGRTP